MTLAWSPHPARPMGQVPPLQVKGKPSKAKKSLGLVILASAGTITMNATDGAATINVSGGSGGSGNISPGSGGGGGGGIIHFFAPGSQLQNPVFLFGGGAAAGPATGSSGYGTSGGAGGSFGGTGGHGGDDNTGDQTAGGNGYYFLTGPARRTRQNPRCPPRRDIRAGPGCRRRWPGTPPGSA